MKWGASAMVTGKGAAEFAAHYGGLLQAGLLHEVSFMAWAIPVFKISQTRPCN
jgi:hypothetical protein